MEIKPNHEALIEALVAIIKKDHDPIRRLLKEIPTAESGQVREALLQQLNLELDAHSAAEEETIYDPLLVYSEFEELVLRLEEEHSDAITLIDELQSLNTNDPEWLTDFDRLNELVEHHLNKEETMLFERIGKTLLSEEIARMADDFERARLRFGAAEIPAA